MTGRRYSRPPSPRLRTSSPLPGTVTVTVLPSTATSAPEMPSAAIRWLTTFRVLASSSGVGGEPSGVVAANVTSVPSRSAVAAHWSLVRKAASAYAPTSPASNDTTRYRVTRDGPFRRGSFGGATPWCGAGSNDSPVTPNLV